MEEYKPDKVLQTVIDKFVSRGREGFKKYGKTLEREDLTTVEWITHAQEEVMDYILYLERLKMDMIKKEKRFSEIDNEEFLAKHVR
jgi:hypothetical protein